MSFHADKDSLLVYSTASVFVVLDKFCEVAQNSKAKASKQNLPKDMMAVGVLVPWLLLPFRVLQSHACLSQDTKPRRRRKRKRKKAEDTSDEEEMENEEVEGNDGDNMSGSDDDVEISTNGATILVSMFCFLSKSSLYPPLAPS